MAPGPLQTRAIREEGSQRPLLTERITTDQSRKVRKEERGSYGGRQSCQQKVAARGEVGVFVVKGEGGVR